jgi:hypothetical protein
MFRKRTPLPSSKELVKADLRFVAILLGVTPSSISFFEGVTPKLEKV